MPGKDDDERGSGDAGHDGDDSGRGEEGQETVDGVPVYEVVALLSVPPEEFVATRTARVKELKAAGDKETATALGKLRKPSRLVWVVGEVARREPDLAAEAVAVAEDAEAATSGSGDVRVVLERFRDVVGRAAAAGAKVDRSTDRPAVELALREILASPAARRAWAGGWLTLMPSEMEPPADELAPRRARRDAERAAAARAEGGAKPATRSPNVKGSAGKGAAKEGTARKGAGTLDPDAEAAARVEAEAERAARDAEAAVRAEAEAALEAAREQARQGLAAAEAARDSASAERDEAKAGLEVLEARLVELEAEVASVREHLATAEAAVEEADEEVAAARSALEELDQT